MTQLLSDPIADPTLPTRRPIVIYDSGVGGLTVARHLIRLLPSDNLLYVADNGWFPYGDKSDLALRGRIFALLHTIVEAACPRAIVIACNTASTAIAPVIDDLSDVPLFVVLPPVAQTVRDARGGPVALLATPNTLRCSLVRRLVDAHASPSQIRFVASMALVHLAERKLAAERVTDANVRAALDAAMLPAERQRMDGVILGCTHFPWLIDEMRPAFPAARVWSDPALDVAGRVAARIGPAERPSSEERVRMLALTSGHNQEHLRRVFARHGFGTGPPLPFAWTAWTPSLQTGDRRGMRWLH